MLCRDQAYGSLAVRGPESSIDAVPHRHPFLSTHAVEHPINTISDA